MPEFQMDKGGTAALQGRLKADGTIVGDVPANFHLPECGAIIEFRDLDEFTGAYIEALFFTDTEPGLTRENLRTPEGVDLQECGSQLPSDYGFADLAPETLRNIMADCAKFQSSECADQILADCYMREGYGPAQAGHDFWLTRCGHGSGFWDRTVLADETLGEDVGRGS